mmetsp:Transcript_4399/g.13048  ORF Transcript_4399/g.13048 Transcript_4399/m.13048 type:complete len:83 (-) Transcript_4399:473-721(-)
MHLLCLPDTTRASFEVDTCSNRRHSFCATNNACPRRHAPDTMQPDTQPTVHEPGRRRSVEVASAQLGREDIAEAGDAARLAQ